MGCGGQDQIEKNNGRRNYHPAAFLVPSSLMEQPDWDLEMNLASE